MHFPLPQTFRRYILSTVARILSPRCVIVAGLVLLVFSWTLCASVLIELRRDASQ